MLFLIFIPQVGYSCLVCGGGNVKEPEFLIGLATSGDPQAQNLLAMMYKKGRGFPRDERKSFYWFKESAENGFRRSFHPLGVMYMEGKGTERNIENGLEWLEKSAAIDQGGISARYLGNFFKEDQDSKNLIKAYKWLKIYSYNFESKELTAIRTAMKPEEIRKAEEMAEEWLSKVQSQTMTNPPM